MQCRTCGITLPRGAAVCPNCGTAVPNGGRVENAGSYEPTIAAGPVNYPNAQPPQAGYGAPPTATSYNVPDPYANQAPRTPQMPQMPQGYSYPTPAPGYQPMPGQLVAPGKPPRKRRTGLIIGIVIGVLVLLCVGGSLITAALLPGNTSKQANSNSQTTTIVSAPTRPAGGSGQSISPAAAAIITGVETAKNANTTTAQPINPSTTFQTYATVYVTFTLDNDKHDFQKEPGYVQAKLYAGTQFIGKKLLQINTAAPGGYFTASYYVPTTGYAELYWCTQESCNDAQLAQVATFTITK